MGHAIRRSELTATLILAVAMLVAGCQSLDPLEPDEPAVTRHPTGQGMTIHASFDTVWPELVEIMQQRGYADFDRERETVSETYQTSVEVENQPRDKVLRETVDEGRGLISATTNDQKRVAFRLVESHGWDSSTLSLIAAATGGDERRHLDHQGVEISVDDQGGEPLAHREIARVMDALQARFEEE